MKCPRCGSEETQVKDSRLTSGGKVVRRRRFCAHCEFRFTTREYASLPTIIVTKRNDRREPFDKQKLLSGLEKACTRRGISHAAMQDFVDQVEEDLIESGMTEVQSRALGSRVLEWLARKDPVAFLRFASVFADFDSPDDFVKWVEHLVQEDAEERAQGAGEDQLPLMDIQ